MEFSGEPLTRWDGSRNMVLEEDFYFIDPKDKQWNAPKGSCLNGATIPRALWSAVGAPYSGRYRRASVVHDVAVGELCNDDVSHSDRKKADRMFYYACREDGCSRRFAFLLYIGVRFGTWRSKRFTGLTSTTKLIDQEEIRDNPEAEYELNKYWALSDSAESTGIFDEENFDALDELIDSELDQ